MNNKTLEVICAAVKASLFQIATPIPNSIDWNEVFTESKKQGIACVVRDGVKNSMPAAVSADWKLFFYQQTGYGVQLVNSQKELVRLLEAHGIHYVILKGTAASVYYPQPHLRSMGDVGFWVPPAYFKQTIELLLDNGYVKSESDDERHLELKKQYFLNCIITSVMMMPIV